MKRHLPKGYREEMAGNAITYVVPLSKYPTTYNGKALWYAALDSRKSHASLHLMGAYGSMELRWRLIEGFRKAGKRLDMGKACIRFRDAAARRQRRDVQSPRGIRDGRRGVGWADPR